jgi:hypothetical protein
LVVLIILHPLLRRAYDSFWRANTYTNVRPSHGLGGQLSHGLTASAAADARLEQRISFDVPFSVIFLAALHGFSILKIIAILQFNYAIATKLPRQYVPAATWIFNIGILFANELCRGYSYERFFSNFLPTPTISEKQERSHNFGHTLDSYGGLMPRWEVLFNFTILRLISFNLDYYWSLNHKVGSRGMLHPNHSFVKLMTSRRSSWTLQTSQKEIVSPSQPKAPISLSAITSHTPHILPYFSLGP